MFATGLFAVWLAVTAGARRMTATGFAVGAAGLALLGQLDVASPCVGTLLAGLVVFPVGAALISRRRPRPRWTTCPTGRPDWREGCSTRLWRAADDRVRPAGLDRRHPHQRADRRRNRRRRGDRAQPARPAAEMRARTPDSSGTHGPDRGGRRRIGGQQQRVRVAVVLCGQMTVDRGDLLRQRRRKGAGSPKSQDLTTPAISCSPASLGVNIGRLVGEQVGNAPHRKEPARRIHRTVGGLGARPPSKKGRSPSAPSADGDLPDLPWS